MSAADHIRWLDRSIARAGDSVVLQRLSVDGEGNPSVSSSANCPAFVRAAAPQDLVGDGAPETRVVLSATALISFGVPQRDDRVVIRGETASIVQIEPIYRDNQLVRVNLLCRA